MRPAYDECTCWRARTPEGKSHPAAWLNAHDRIAVTAVDGYRVEGRPAGMLWYTSEDGHAPAPGLCIDLDDGSEMDVPVAEIETVRPWRPRIVAQRRGWLRKHWSSPPRSPKAAWTSR